MKSVPQFVVGCKADLRHCNLDEFNARCGQLATKVALKYEFQSFDHSFKVYQDDLLYPWQGRAVATEVRLFPRVHKMPRLGGIFSKIFEDFQKYLINAAAGRSRGISNYSSLSFGRQ